MPQMESLHGRRLTRSSAWPCTCHVQPLSMTSCSPTRLAPMSILAGAAVSPPFVTWRPRCLERRSGAGAAVSPPFVTWRPRCLERRGGLCPSRQRPGAEEREDSSPRMPRGTCVEGSGDAGGAQGAGGAAWRGGGVENAGAHGQGGGAVAGSQGGDGEGGRAWRPRSRAALRWRRDGRGAGRRHACQPKRKRRSRMTRLRADDAARRAAV